MSLRRAQLTVLLALVGCGAPPQTYAGAGSPAGASAPAKDVEVSVRMSDDLETSAEDDVVAGEPEPAHAPITDEAANKPKKKLSTKKGSRDEVAAPPPPPPPPPPGDFGADREKRPAESAGPRAATADSAGGRVDSAAIQAVIAKNVDAFRPCLRSDLSLRIDASISPSGEVLEARSPRSFPDDAKARDCVVLSVKRLHFERFDGASPARVSFELTLKRSLEY